MSGTGMTKISFNGNSKQCETTEALGVLLDEFNHEATFELWIEIAGGPFMGMLRNGENAFLMYLRFAGDAGVPSRAAVPRPGTATFRLSNGQIDEYPLSWCLEVDQCYQAIAYFFVNEGTKPDWIHWHN
jgi:hypothetical protein